MTRVSNPPPLLNEYMKNRLDPTTIPAPPSTEKDLKEIKEEINRIKIVLGEVIKAIRVIGETIKILNE